MLIEEIQQLQADYAKLTPTLNSVCIELEGLVKKALVNSIRIDSIRHRVKDIDSFVNKAQKLDETNEQEKYPNPLREIQDQAGFRVVVYYQEDVCTVKQLLLKEFREIEDQRVVPDDVWKFGYEARHLIFLIPRRIRKEYQPHIDFFELQICTLFQHAWSQANHDLTYKPKYKKTEGNDRLAAWAASQAWGADKAFSEIINNN